MKVSKVQLEVLKLMSNGWELGKDMYFNSRAWIQKGGIGRGGEAKTVSFATVFKLYKEQLILPISSLFPTEKFALTEKGKQVMKENEG